MDVKNSGAELESTKVTKNENSSLKSPEPLFEVLSSVTVTVYSVSPTQSFSLVSTVISLSASEKAMQSVGSRPVSVTTTVRTWESEISESVKEGTEIVNASE
jgi:hypothetical protein